MNHSHEHSSHHHHHASGKPLYFSVVAILLFAIVELIGGLLAGSLALVGDAGHMFTDAAALTLAAFAAWLSQKPPTEKHSYGLLRAEIVAALINGIFMLSIVFSIVREAIERIQTPTEVAPTSVMIIAFIGLVINIIVAWVLSRGDDNLNTRAALLHVMADLLGSVAALLSGVIIYFTGWYMIDPLLSLFICGLILFSTYHLLKEAVHVIMEGVPSHLELQTVGVELAAINNVVSIHDLHIWTLSSGKIALSAHVVVKDLSTWSEILENAKDLLNNKFSIEHITLQPEEIKTEVISTDF